MRWAGETQFPFNFRNGLEEILFFAKLKKKVMALKAGFISIGSIILIGNIKIYEKY